MRFPGVYFWSHTVPNDYWIHFELNGSLDCLGQMNSCQDRFTKKDSVQLRLDQQEDRIAAETSSSL